MGNRLYTDNYKEFIRGVASSDHSIRDIVKYTQKSMPLIADDLNVGRLEAIVLAKPNLIDRVGFNGRELLYQSEDGYNPVMHSMKFKTGGGVSITMNAYPVKDYEWSDIEKDDLRFICANFFALFEKARLSNVMKKAAVTESMTGASNIAGLLQTLGEYKAEKRLGEYTSVFMNIKDFKFINKSVGIVQGDNVLRGFVEKMYGFLMPDEIVARLGGDNFVVIIRDDRVDEFLKQVSPLVLTNESVDGRETMNISFRMGIFDVDNDTEISDVLSNASTALAETRKDGFGDVVWFKTSLQEERMANQQATFLFSEALNNREFVVYYQPKVRLEDNKLCGCEALVRWIRDGKVTPPMSFIPALEQDGSICQLDFYVFENVCRDIRMWIDAGLEPVKVSVNFSKYHLKSNEASKKIITTMQSYNIDPKYIEVELTESACYEDADMLKKFLKDMEDYGIAVSIDDFGTGYSSLSLLKSLMVDIIKLDQSFVRAIDGEDENEIKNDMVVIKNIVNMVRELDMDIIAEGVETADEAGFLRDVNCNMAQGYLFDKPMPHDDFEVLLRSNRSYE